MKGALKLDDELIEDKLDEEMYSVPHSKKLTKFGEIRKQDMAATDDSHRPSSREAFQNSSRPYANKSARRASTAADMHQGFRDPGRCKLSSENPNTTERGPGAAVRRRISSGFVSRSIFRELTIKSPSTDSTTSLAQLRDKLTVLSPCIFNKVIPTIATTPELPVLKELDEQENLSNSLTKTKHYGVSLKYHSDSEAQAQTITKKTGCLLPVIEEHSAALDKTEESVTNEKLGLFLYNSSKTFEDLYKNNNNFGLADLLMVEALQHGQEKDIGIISGKVTQDSEVVENTPVENDARHKKLSIKRDAKSIVQDQPEIDESELEVIDDTPCYVYDRKKRVRKNSTKAVNKTTQEIVTLDETAIDAFFSQLVNQNNTENIVSPTLAKKINETSSGASDDDCIITEDHFMNNKLSVNDLAVEVDILDCVKGIVDKVCNHLDKYVESLAEQERQIVNLSYAKNIDDNSNVRSDVFTVSNNKLKADKDIPHEHNSDESRKVILKFNRSKKVAPKMNTRRKAIKSDKDPNDAGISKVLIENTNTSFPINSTKATSTRNKRKLYSPKNDENDNNEIQNQENRVERRQSNVNQTPIATCYRELENARKSQIKDHRKSRASARTIKNGNKGRYSLYSDGENPSSIGPVLSPKTRKLDEMFDLIKDNVVNEEKITLVEKKSCMKDLSLNMSSESENADFKKKRYQVHKRISSSSLDVPATKRRRSGTQVNYSEYSSDDEGKRTRKSKMIKQTKPRSRKTNKIPKTHLIDERMRVSQQDTLETSFVKETVDVKNLEEPVPALPQAPTLEVMPLDNFKDDLKEAVALENKTNTPAKLDISKIKKEDNSKKCEKVTRSTVTKTCKENIKNVSKEKDTASVSPLPGHVVETEGTWKDKSYIKDPRKSRAITRSKKNSKKARYSMYSDGEDPPFRIRERTSSSSIVSTRVMSTRERAVNLVNCIDTLYPTLLSSSENDEHCRAVKLKIAKKIKPRGRKLENKSNTPPVLSPKTRKFNEMFDKIKDNVVNEEKITLIEKKRCRKDLSLYNLSSESEDGNFKKQQYQLHKGISSSSLASATKHRRSATQVNYSEYSTENEGKKSKTIKQTKPRSRKTNKIPKTDLIDERMRVAQQDTLETSFVKEKVYVKNLEEPEPALQQVPALVFMPSDNFNDDIKEAVVLENKTQRPVKSDISKIKKENNGKKCEKVTRSTATKKEKEEGKKNLKNVSKEKDSASVSPLPGLVVETEGTRKDDMTSLIETNLLQKLKKMYTEVHDLNETDETRTLLLNEGDNDNAVLDPNDIVENVLESDLLSERSIATGGRSPITGHNDLNESPPNIELLNEDFQHRDVHNEGMSESMAEFLANMRNQLHIQTSPLIPITRMSTKDSVRSTACAKRKSSRESINKSISDATSNKSNEKVVLNTVPPKVESKLNPVGTPKSKVSSVVLTRMSSEEIEKYLSTHTKKSSETGTPKIVLERISSDEINRWLPIPLFKDKDMDEQPNKYNTRRTSQLTDTNIPDSVFEKKVKGKISPVKLSFDVAGLTMAGYGTRTLRTQSSTKSKSHANNNKELKTDSIKSSVPKAQTCKNENFIKNSQETSKSSAITRSKPDETATSVDPSMSKSIASVQDWLKKNVSPSAANNDAMKEMLAQVMETLQTTLEEIHQTTGEGFIAACMENQREISGLQKDMEGIREQLTRIEEKIATIKKNQMQRACEKIRAYAEKKAQLVKLLQEDIQRVLN